MLGESLEKHGADFFFLCEDSDSPAARRYPGRVVNSPERFVSLCETFTLENEFHTPQDLARLLGPKAEFLFPALESYRHFENKIAQRTLFQQLGLASPSWEVLTSSETSPQTPYPLIAKAPAGGYDGKGVRVIRNQEELDRCGIEFGYPLLIEEKIQLKTEVAQGFVRTRCGEIALLPLVETLQENGVCHLVEYPARVSQTVRDEVEKAVKKLADFPLVGIFNFEFFVDDQDRVTINEGAPRPHNSQHLTIDASTLSQFELLAIALTGGPFAEVSTRPSLMVNILGKNTGVDLPLILPKLPESVRVVPKLYGKLHCKPGRKMGHVNLVDESTDHDLRKLGEKILREYDL